MSQKVSQNKIYEISTTNFSSKNIVTVYLAGCPLKLRSLYLLKKGPPFVSPTHTHIH